MALSCKSAKSSATFFIESRLCAFILLASWRSLIFRKILLLGLCSVQMVDGYEWRTRNYVQTSEVCGNCPCFHPREQVDDDLLHMIFSSCWQIGYKDEIMWPTVIERSCEPKILAKKKLCGNRDRKTRNCQGLREWIPIVHVWKETRNFPLAVSSIMRIAPHQRWMIPSPTWESCSQSSSSSSRHLPRVTLWLVTATKTILFAPWSPFG